MTDQRLQLELDSEVAVITLDHPPLNIYDLAMRDALIEALGAVRDTPWVRALLLRSAGRHFCAGAQLAEFGSADSVFEARRIRWDRDPWGLLWELSVPTVVALRGVTFGSGLEMALLCDIRVAAPDSQLGLPETKLGMLPGAGGSQSLTRALGPHSALPWVLTADTLGAEESLARGLVHQVAGDVDATAREIAAHLAQLEPGVAASLRRLLHAAGDLPLEQGLALEHRLARMVRRG